MPTTFNGTTLRATLDAGVTSIDAADLYSEWKNWLLASHDNMKYPRMFYNSEGNTPKGAGEFTPAYFFVNTMWKIVPDSADHELVVNGNLLGDPNETPVPSPYEHPAGGWDIVIQRKLSDQAQLGQQKIRDSMTLDTTEAAAAGSIDKMVDRIDKNTQGT